MFKALDSCSVWTVEKFHAIYSGENSSYVFHLVLNFIVFQEAHPVRLKKIYIVHTAWFVNQAFAIVKPFIKTELMSLLQFTTGGPDEIFPLEVLPEVSEE